MKSKQKYIPLTMKEVNKKNGKNRYNAVSTFSGCGGSSIGLKLAGFNVLYANEFIPAAQETYSINNPNTYLDKRDIRTVKPKEILDKIGLDKGELDLFEGSPPCSTFSNCGLKEKAWGKIKTYSDTRQRVDDLFYEYTRILKGLQPKMFVAENVKGLTQAKSRGYLKLIYNELKKAGYNVYLAILNSKWYNIPQMRERLIIIGVRKDLKVNYNYPVPLQKDGFTIRDAIPKYMVNETPTSEYVKVNPETLTGKYLRWCQRHKKYKLWYASDYYTGKSSFYTHIVHFHDVVSPTLLQSGNHYHAKYMRTLSIFEGKRIQTIPDDYILTGNRSQKWERIGRSVPPRLYEQVGLSIVKTLNKL